MLGRKDLQKAINTKMYEGVAKNVIFFVGDGLGISTHTMARIYKVGLVYGEFWVSWCFRARRKENLERKRVLLGKIFLSPA